LQGAESNHSTTKRKKKKIGLKERLITNGYLYQVKISSIWQINVNEIDVTCEFIDIQYILTLWEDLTNVSIYVSDIAHLGQVPPHLFF
jgi:hypothetical protein